MFLVRETIEWVLGFAVYLAFLTLCQSGSILQQLKTLFVGSYPIRLKPCGFTQTEVCGYKRNNKECSRKL